MAVSFQYMTKFTTIKKKKLQRVRRSQSKEAGLQDELSMMAMDLFMMMTEMQMKRQTMHAVPSFH